MVAALKAAGLAVRKDGYHPTYLLRTRFKLAPIIRPMSYALVCTGSLCPTRSFVLIMAIRYKKVGLAEALVAMEAHARDTTGYLSPYACAPRCPVLP